MPAESNLITSAGMTTAKVREIDFVYRFNDSLKKLLEVLGVTRQIPKTAGTVLKAYTASGTLGTGNVDEGDLIPLSKYDVKEVKFTELKLQKWAKATTAEAIIDKGYDQAVAMTTDAMLKDVQKGIKKKFFDFLKTGSGSATGKTFQETLAQIWGQLQTKYEDTEIESVYFINPLAVADYLATANVTLQTAFGLTYIEDFLGLGTVILNSGVEKDKIYGTAKENIVLYYMPMTGTELNIAFDMTTDETGFIGIHEEADYRHATCEDTVYSGVVLFAERLDGIIKGTISGGE